MKVYVVLYHSYDGDGDYDDEFNEVFSKKEDAVKYIQNQKMYLEKNGNYQRKIYHVDESPVIMTFYGADYNEKGEKSMEHVDYIILTKDLK